MTGQELRSAVLAKGVSIQYGKLSTENIEAYWRQQANAYETAEAFLDGIGLQKGGTATVPFFSSGDLVVSDLPTMAYSGSNTFAIGNKVLQVAESGKVTYGTAWGNPTVFGCSYVWLLEFSEPGSGEPGIIKKISATAYTGAFFNNRYPDDDYAVIDGEYYFSVDLETAELLMHRRCSCERRYTKHLGYGSKGYDVVHSADYKNWEEKSTRTGFYLLDLADGEIRFSWSSGGGTENRTTMQFLAVSGLSGRHSDPQHGAGSAKLPTARSEKPSYGSGGFGGHGGGGGAGSATVVVRKFATSRADALEVTAQAKRHGYGSGGGKGGKGGDGCILIFW